MKHPYNILIGNLKEYSKTLSEDEILQVRPNVFQISDKNFKTLKFLQDVEKETGIAPLEHQYVGAKCADTTQCFKPYIVYGFDNVLFYIESKDY